MGLSPSSSHGNGGSQSNALTVGHAVPVCAGLVNFAISPKGTMLVAVSDADDTITKVSLPGLKVNPAGSAPIATGVGANTVAFSASGLLVFCCAYDGTVTVVGTSAWVVRDPLTAGGSPQGIACSPTAPKAYVCNFADGTLSIIDFSDVDAITITGTIAVGDGPYNVAFKPDGTKAYVANYGDGTFSVIDTTADTVTDTVTVGTNPVLSAFSPDGTKAYIINGDDNEIQPIDVATDTPGAAFSAGGSPYSLTWFPDGSKILVGNENEWTITPVDAATDTPGDAFLAGQQIFWLATGQPITTSSATFDSPYFYASAHDEGTIIPIRAQTLPLPDLVIY